MSGPPSSPSPRTLALLAAELRQHLPFAEMAEEDVRAYVAAARESYHAPGERLHAPADGVARRLTFIRRGTVRSQRPGQGAPSQFEAGDLLPVAAVLAARPVTSTYEAVDDVFGLEVDADTVQRLASRSAPFADFLHRRVERLLDASRQRLREAQAAELLAERSQQAPLSELPRRTPVTCTPATPLRDALRQMHATRVGSIVAVDAQGAPVGILTRHDLLERVVLAERDLDTPVRDVMTAPVAALTLQDNVQTAMLEMARRGIRHLPLTDQGRMVGMVSERDLYALQRQSTRQIGRQIREAADVPALAAAAAQIRAFARHLIGQGLSSPSLTSILSGLNDRLTERLVEITAAAHGLDLTQACWLAFGSEGRGEQTVATDQDNGLVLAEGADRPRWLAFGGAVNESLAACGYPLCSGGVMAGQEACCLTLAGWLDRFDRWIDRSEPEDLLAASIYFDLRAVAGRLELAAPLHERIVQQAPRAPLFLRLLATQALERRPPLNWRGAIAATDDASGRETVDLKLQGTAIFVDAARLLALAHGLPALGTRERLLAAGPVAGVPERECTAWVGAFDHLQLLRLRAQLAATDLASANRVEVGTLDPIDRRVLREAFRVARELQQKIEVDLAR